MAGRRRTAFVLMAGLAVLLGVLAPTTVGSSSHRAEALRAPAPAAKHGKLASPLAKLARSASERVHVELLSSRPEQDQALIERAGGRVLATSGRLVEATVPASALSTIAGDRTVQFVREPVRPVAEAVRGEGVNSTGATVWHRSGLRGAGARIAVIDLGFAGWRDSRKNGDLPASTVAVDFCRGNFDGRLAPTHGTAVAEIVAEMAPAARLHLICVSTIAGLRQAKDYARAQRIHIVNHSASWFSTSRGDDTGGPETPTGIVADARANGILWVNAAGNRAQQHWSGTFVDADADGWHEFAPGDEGNSIFVPAGQRPCIALKWDSWPVTALDYDLYLTRTSDGAHVAFSTTDQNGIQLPTELVCHANASGQAEQYAVGIRHAEAPTGVTPQLDLFVYPSPNLEHQVPAGSVTEPGSSSFAMAVGAVCWRTNALESFSSQGPTIDGRLKPDIAGPDWVSSFSYGPFGGCGARTGFAGTSASTPHVAGAAALIKGANPSFGPNELQAYIEARALDLGLPGRDAQYGVGKLTLGASPRPPLRAVCVVPRVRGLSLAKARAKILRARCSVGRIKRTPSGARQGRVIAQRPPAGRRVPQRSKVNLTLSLGRQ